MKPRSLIIFSIIAALTFGCKVTKQIANTDTEVNTEVKTDSVSNVSNDITTESKTETTVTETIDSAVFITPKGELLIDTTGRKDAIRVPIKKKKTTKTNSEVKEVDKSKSKTDLKKKEENKSEVKTVDKEVKKTSIPWYWWLILVVATGLYFGYRFYFRK